MANVTYLLGAGASYNALPVVDEITDQISILIGVLELIKNGQSPQNVNGNYNIFNISSNSATRQIVEIAINDLKKLRNGCMNHLSIDTYLKMLFLTRNNLYERMKATIVLFFCLYQELRLYISYYNNVLVKKEAIDKRYDAFFAAILQSSFDQFPNKIKILSWNYDNQFERTYHRYLQNADSSSTTDELLNIYHRNETRCKFDTSKFAIYKINGTASYFDKNRKILPQINPNEKNVNETLIRILSEYNSCVNDNTITPAISFAWDNEHETQKMINTIQGAILESDVLVIIGYSIPFFNRQIDKQILSKNTIPKSIKIYVQDKEPNGIIERLYGIRPPQTTIQTPQGIQRHGELILPITDLRQFYLPDEL